MTGKQIAQRFLLLTALGYAVAIACIAGVIWTTSQPFLRDAHTAALQDLAGTQAHTAEMALDDTYDTAAYLAASPIVQDLVVGIEDENVAQDMIAAWSTRRNVQQVQILDYAGRSVLRYVPEANATPIFHAVELRSGLRTVFNPYSDTTREGQFHLRYNRETGYPHIMLTIPVRVRDVTEGMLAVEQVIPFNGSLGKARLATEFQLDLQSDGSNDPPIVEPVPGTPFFMSLDPDTSVATTRSVDLVASILTGLVGVLLLPFLAMGVFGFRHIVAPTQALEASRAALARQQDQLKHQKQELRELARIAELTKDAVIVTDLSDRILWTNQSFEILTGYTTAEATGRKPGTFLNGPATNPETIQRISAALKARVPVREEILNYTKFGDPYWAAVSISPLTNEYGEVHRFASICSDMSERKKYLDELSKAQQESEYRALHDTMTGLPNRAYLDRVLAREVTSKSEPRTLIRVDLDFFKNVNDTHGHAAGDHVLRTVAHILRNHTRRGDLAARVGGDEFVVLMAQGASTEEAAAFCNRLRQEICQDIVFEGKTCRVGASFGVASACDGLVGNTDLLVGADAALYVSKDKGRNTTTLYTPEVHRDVLDKRRSAGEIEKAIQRQEFEPFFQPQVCARTRAFRGIEALARWRHPLQGVLSPPAFLPIAEQMALVPEIDAIIYEKGLQSVERLTARGYVLPKVSFNVGVAQLEDPALGHIHKSFRLGETRIAFEVLESVLVEEQSSTFSFRVDQLRDSGFQIEVDDFGSGHASIIGLMQLQPDVMKLDQRLVLPLMEHGNARIIVQSLVEIGKSLGIKITAEGVETEAHADLLRDIGVNTLQGYCFAPPLTAEGLESYLKSNAEQNNATYDGSVVALQERRRGQTRNA